MFPLFKIPKGISVTKFKELLKDNPVYKKYLRVKPDEDEKY